MTVDREEVRNRLNRVFREVFEDDDIVIREDTIAKDVSGWDSLMHIVLIVAAEKEFGVELNAVQVGKLQNVGELIDIFMQKLK